MFLYACFIFFAFFRQEFDILPQTIFKVDVASVPNSLCTGLLAGVVLRQLHPIHGGNPWEVAVGISEHTWILRTVLDGSVQNPDLVTGLGHGEGSSVGILVGTGLVELPDQPTSGIAKKETRSLARISIAFSACWVERLLVEVGVGVRSHPGRVLTSHLFCLKRIPN